jgi:hypothetical protein
MSDPDDQSSPAASPPTRAAEASRRLSQLLARPLGTPAPPSEAPEPYVPRPARAAPLAAPEPPPAAEAPDDTASVTAPPPVAPDEPDLPWFGQAAPPKPPVDPPVPEAAANTAEPDAPSGSAPVMHNEPRDEPAGIDDDLFHRREPPPLHAPAPSEDEFGFGALRSSEHGRDPEPAPPSRDHVPEWAWPSALDRSDPEPAPPQAIDLDALPRATVPEPERSPPPEAPPAAPAGAKPLDPDATRTLSNIRRLMLASNLFVVVAIGAVLAVVGYRLYRTEPAPPPPPPAPPPAVAPAPAKIPLDMTLTLPRGARIVQTAVAGERLVITLEIDGATEIRTFDIKTLQPTGRMSFGIVP